MPIVGAVLGAIAAGTALYGAISGASAKQSAGDAAAQLTHQEADETRRQTEEQYRRATLQNEQAIGMTNARVNSSGFASPYSTAPNSMSQYAKAFATELGTEAAWLKDTGFRKAALQDQAAEVQRQAAQAGFWGDITGGISTSIGTGTSIFNTLKGADWMKGPPTDDNSSAVLSTG